MPNPDTLDPEQAYQEMQEFLSTEVDRIIHELEVHDLGGRKVDQPTVARVRQQIEQPNTVRVEEDDFTIIRNANHGLDIDWHADQRAA